MQWQERVITNSYFNLFYSLEDNGADCSEFVNFDLDLTYIPEIERLPVELDFLTKNMTKFLKLNSYVMN